jgi:G3E family GTPase
MTDIYIISGFLGAGKTTLIEKLLRTCFADKNTVLVENDFGKVNIDAALLKSGGFQVRELSGGCICCTLTGDFVKSIQEVISAYSPEIILIEPSGVGKLSDIEQSCYSMNLTSCTNVCQKITAVDVTHCRSYLENFGEFFKDQVQGADILYLTRVEATDAKIKNTKHLLREINAEAPIVMSASELINLIGQKKKDKAVQPESDDNCHCHHNHETDGNFETVTIQFQNPVNMDKIKQSIEKLEQSKYTHVLRAKGILKWKENRYISLQYVPGELNTMPTVAVGNYLCFIGSKLDRIEVKHLFDGGTIL